MNKYVASIRSIAQSHVKQSLTDEARGIPAHLCNTIALEWERECEKLISNLMEIFDNRLRKEIPWGTANHYLTSKFKGEEALPNELVDDFLSNVDFDAEGAGDEEAESEWTPDTIKSYLKRKLEAAKDRWSTKFSQSTTHEQQQERLFYAVKAVWAVEHKTFTDYILKETNEHLLAP